MTAPDPTSPHDALFKAIFSQGESAVVLLREGLPPEVVEAIDPATLHVEPSSFVDDELRGSHSDLLLSALLRHGAPLLVYVLIEHQSTVDPLMPFRLLRYVVRVWERWLRENPDASRLPAVIPLVVHQGPRPWNGPVRLQDVLELPAGLLAAVARYLPALEMALHDLGRASLERLGALAGPAAARFALVLLRAAASGEDLAAVFERFMDVVRELYSGSRGPENLRLLVSYTVVVGRLDVAELGARVRQAIGPGAAEVVMTTGQELIKQGLEQGREEGRRQLRNILERQLRSRFGDLGADVLARLEKATTSELERWADRVLTATRLADVLAAGAGAEGDSP